ncbi:Acyl-peptide hydrolase [Nocardioides sp. PD653]|nr:Acyl-peptide hydrolase [Nocardioides sp. PD653-B2]GAW55782.1 Acyl-peptide hydrolase [Nocardioides sp. PD653]
MLGEFLDGGIGDVEQDVAAVCRDARDAGDEVPVEEVELEQGALVLDRGVEGQRLIGEGREV